MPRRPNIRPSRTGAENMRAANRDQLRERLEADLSRTLSSIATLLISSGYAYGKMSRLARVAFVDAAVETCTADGKRPSIAQIAAATGLTRTEVSNILRQRKRSLRAVDSKNRSNNVAAGWASDNKYCNTTGIPRPLQFKGRRADFSSLVKKYSGDIPARAMLREMQRLGMVRCDSRGLIRLERKQVPIEMANVRAFKAVEPWMTLLKETVLRNEKQLIRADTSQVELYFDSIPQLLAVLRNLKERRTAFVDGIAGLGGRSAGDNNYSMRINIAVAVARPIRTKENSNRRT